MSVWNRIGGRRRPLLQATRPPPANGDKMFLALRKCLRGRSREVFALTIISHRTWRRRAAWETPLACEQHNLETLDVDMRKDG
jgi:hypothetical protein